MATPVGVTGYQGTSATPTATLPATITSGSKAWVLVVYDSATSLNIPATPSGWTLESTDASGSGTNVMSLYSKPVGSADQNAVITFTKGQSGSKLATSGCVVDATYDHSAAGFTAGLSATAATSHTAPTRSGLGSGVVHAVMLIGTRGSAAVTTITLPGYTAVSSAYGTGGGSSASVTMVNTTDDTDGSVGGGTVTYNAAQGMGAYVLALPVATASVNLTPASVTPSAIALTPVGPISLTPAVVGLTGVALKPPGLVTLTPAVVAVSAPAGVRPNDPVQMLPTVAYIAHRGGANENDRPESTLWAQQQVLLYDHPKTIMDVDAALLATDGSSTTAQRIGFTHAYDDLSENGGITDAGGNLVTGHINTKTVAQWDTYKQAVRSGRTGPPRPVSRWPVMAQLLHDNPTRVMAIETKTADVLTPLINAIIAEGLQGQIIGHSFDYSRCVAMAAAGLHVAYLVDALTTTIANNAKAAGIEYVFGGRTLIASDYGTIAHAAGLKVGIYTVQNKTNRDAAIATWGADVIITDFPQGVNNNGSVDLVDADVSVSAVVLAPVPGLVTTSLTRAASTVTSVAVSPVPQPVTVSLAPAAMAVAVGSVSPAGGPSIVSLSPASVAASGRPLTAVPSVVTVSLSPASATVTASSVSPQPMAVSVTLTPASVTVTAVSVSPASQSGTVTLTATALTLSARPLSPSPGVVGVTLVSASVTLTARPLSAGGPVGPVVPRILFAVLRDENYRARLR